MERILENIEEGNADQREIPMLEEISRSIEGHTICALGDAAAWPVQGKYTLYTFSYTRTLPTLISFYFIFAFIICFIYKTLF